MTCECGTPVRPGQAFCGQCGRAVPETAPSPSPTPGSPVTIPTVLPTGLATDSRDLWKLGSLAVLLLSLFLPIVSLPAGISLTVLRFGALAWIGGLALLVLATLTAVPAWRPPFWPVLERFFSAAAVGSVATVFVGVIGLASAISHFVQSLNNSSGTLSGLSTGLVSNSLALSIHVGFGLIVALVGAIAWAVATKRPPGPKAFSQ